MDVRVGLWRKLSTEELMSELRCWRRLLRVPWTARRTNQSILKEISPGYSLEGTMLKLKRQYFGHLMWRVDSLEKTLMLGGIGGRRRRGQHRMRWLDGITNSMDMNLVNSGSRWWTGRPGVLQFMGLQRVGHDWATELNMQRQYIFRMKVLLARAVIRKEEMSCLWSSRSFHARNRILQFDHVFSVYEQAL